MTKKGIITTGSMIIRDVPFALRRGFKARCAQEGVSMQAKVISLIAAYIDDTQKEE